MAFKYAACAQKVTSRRSAPAAPYPHKVAQEPKLPTPLHWRRRGQMTVVKHTLSNEMCFHMIWWPQAPLTEFQAAAGAFLLFLKNDIPFSKNVCLGKKLTIFFNICKYIVYIWYTWYCTYIRYCVHIYVASASAGGTQMGKRQLENS